MKRAELDMIKNVLHKGKQLDGYEVQDKPAADRPGYMWVPHFEGSVVVWTEEVDENYMPEGTGTYIDPIKYITGLTVKEGYFYTDGDNIWEAIKDGVPQSFEDKDYFDIIV